MADPSPPDTDRLAQIRERRGNGASSLDDPYDDVRWLLAEVDRLRAALDQQREQLDMVLARFTQKGHPGEPCLRTGWISERTVKAWREAARGSGGPTG